MVCFQRALMAVVAVALINSNEAASPFFLQAITSALGTIPFTAGPMTTGLVGAKLAVGSKLLYYLGFFGRRRSKPKPSPVRVSPQKFPGGMQAMPMPFGGGFPQQFGGFGQQGFGGFGQGFGGFGQGFGGFGQQLGYDPAQLFQMLAAQGIDPTAVMQTMGGMEGMGMGGGQAIPASQFPFPSGGGMAPVRGGAGGLGMPQNPSGEDSQSGGEGGSDSELESFFTFLRDMDDNTCISRLMCDIGANPSFLGDFSENIHSIISSLDVLPSSGAFQYIRIMETGKREGGCGKKFPQCSDAAYEVVKNVAPSVGVPHNINSETVNQL